MYICIYGGCYSSYERFQSIIKVIPSGYLSRHIEIVNILLLSSILRESPLSKPRHLSHHLFSLVHPMLSFYKTNKSVSYFEAELLFNITVS